MPYEVATIPIQAALQAILEGSSPLTAMVNVRPSARGGGPAIYDDRDVPQGAPMPYLTIGAWTQVDESTLGEFGCGWNCTGMIKAVGQRALVAVPGQSAEKSITLIMSRVFALLPKGLRLSVTGYGSAYVDEMTLQPPVSETTGGIISVGVPAIVRVIVHDD